MGKFAYRQRKYIYFLLGTTLLLSLLFLLLLVSFPIIFASVLEIIVFAVAIFFTAIIATILLNAIIIIDCIFPTDDDILSRTSCRLMTIEKKLSKSSKSSKNHSHLCKKRELLSTKKQEFESRVKKKNKLDQKEIRTATTSYHLRTIVAVGIALVIVFTICMPLAFFVGYHISEANGSYTIVVNQPALCQEFEQMVSADQEVNALAVLYKNENNVVIAPCNINEKEIIVYSKYQRVVDIDGLVFQQIIY